MTKTACTTALLICLIATAALLLIRAATLAPARPATADTATIEAARDYVSALQTYLINGDLDTLNSNWREEIELAALRQTYPAIDISLLSARPQDDSYFVVISTGESHLPVWLKTGTEPADSVQIVTGPNPFETGRLPLDQPPVSWLPLTPEDFIVHGNAGDQLLLVRMTIDSAQTIANYFPLPGPAVYAVEQGGFEIAGNGVAMIASRAGGEPVLTEPGRTYLAEPGTMLLIPNDRLVIRIPTGTLPMITGSLIVSTAVDPAFLQGTRGETALTDPARQIAQAATEWREEIAVVPFGTLETLRAGVNLSNGGQLALGAGWLVVPADSHLAIDRSASEFAIAAVRAGDDLALVDSGSHRWIINNGDRTVLVLVAWIEPVH